MLLNILQKSFKVGLIHSLKTVEGHLKLIFRITYLNKILYSVLIGLRSEVFSVELRVENEV